MRYFWHTDNQSLEELRLMFQKLMDKFHSRVMQVENAKRENYLDKKMEIGLLNIKLENQRKKRKVENED